MIQISLYRFKDAVEPERHHLEDRLMQGVTLLVIRSEERFAPEEYYQLYHF
jgi:hypothetical protein